MKKRTLLFGAGQGARVYIKNTEQERHFIGFLDNDEGKYDRPFDGLPVYSPKNWPQLEFDEIVITTQWALDVQEQLLGDLNVPADKICLPKKSQLKTPEPFRDPATLQLARDIVLSLNQLARDRGVGLMLDFGTLLGISRDGDLIPWDDDIDFSAPEHEADAVEQVVRKFINKTPRADLRWSPERVTDRNGRVSCLLLRFKPAAASTLRPFTTSLCFREYRDGQAIHMPSLGMWYAPEKHFRSVELLDWHGKQLQVPVAHQHYLAFVYGDSWATPKQNIQLSDYAHLNETDFTAIRDAAFVTSALEILDD